MHGVWILVHSYLRVRFDLPSSINSRYLNGVPKLGHRTLIRSHPRGSKVAPLDSTGMMPYLAPFPSYSLQQVQHRYSWLPFLHTPLATQTEGFFWDDLRKILQGGRCVARVKNGVETFSEKFNRLSRAHERYRRQTERRIHDSKCPNVR